MLSRSTTGALSPELRPLVDPGELRPRIVHFGLGAFHRAHQAVYTEATRDYVTRRTKEGMSKKDLIRCLKRSIARQIYRAIRDDLQDLALTT